MEYVLHQRVSAHPSVVTMHGIQRHGSTFFLVLDYLPGGDLFNFIDDGRCHGEDKLVKDLFLQLLDAVEYCHSKSGTCRLSARVRACSLSAQSTTAT
jgi:serine/threonine protein kinase